MEELSSSETPVNFYYTEGRHISENSDSYENRKIRNRELISKKRIK
jgi:hypothetical protein